MKNYLILFVLLCTLKPCAHAVTYVSGIISTNTTWTKVNSPYIVNGDLSVDSTVTLTIEPGVMVRVDSGYFFYVDGSLIAEGTSTDTISFMANNTNSGFHRWAGIRFRIKAKDDTSRIKYCLFENGGIALFNQGTFLYVSNSVFRYSFIAAINTWGMSPPINYFTMIDSCLITECNNGVVNTSTSSIPNEFTHNDVTYNVAGYYDESIYGAVINYNNFSYNQQGASLSGGLQKKGPKWNTFKGNSTLGLSIIGGNPMQYMSTPVSENLFIYNMVALQLSDVGVASITNNTIAYNDIAITHAQNYVNNPGSSPMIIANNCITNSISHSFKEYSQIDFQVKNNWWGTTSTPGIDSTIHDYYDNFSSGKITYIPILTSSSGCQSVDPPPLCFQPGPVVANAISSTTATVVWPSVPGAPAYEYYVNPISLGPKSSGSLTFDTSLSLTGLTPGQTYTVCVRTKCVASPFLSAWVCDTVTIPNTGINTEPLLQPVRIYPNPGNGTFTLELANTDLKNASVTMYDMMGRECYRSSITSSQSQIKLSQPSGIYLLKLQLDATILTKRVIVQ